MKRLAVFLGLALFLLLPTSVSAAHCQFVLGFKTLRDLVGHDVVGECLENEHYEANGDSLQQTTGGLLVWRKADNWTAFTDGYRSWINGPNGLEQRLNTQRFDWEAGYSPLTSIVSSTRSTAPAHTPARSLVALAAGSPWYQDGLDHDHISFPEPRAVRAFEKIDRNNPQLARVMSRWAWMFDEDMRTNEVSVIEYIASLDEKFPWFVPYIVELPWVQDGLEDWETSAISDLYAIALGDDLDFALELATAPWVVDGVSALETYAGTSSLNDIAGHYQYPLASPALARQALSYVDYPPSEVDLYLLKALGTILALHPDGLSRLLTEPWFVDGLNEEERVYLIAAAGSVSNSNELFEPYHIASSAITLPQSGVVNLWIVRRQPFHPGDDAIANLAEAVRASEQFLGVPFPVEHVILSLLIEGGRGIHLGHMMVLTPYEGKLSLAPYHEVAHYYFNSGPTWLAEGGANFVTHYFLRGGNVSTIEFPEFCRENGVHNLHALNKLGGGDLWDGCRYSMGLHFLVALREAMGDTAWRSALRAFYVSVGYRGLYLSGWQGAPEDEEIYHVFLEHTPHHLVEAVRDVFRRLHGGPFVD